MYDIDCSFDKNLLVCFLPVQENNCVAPVAFVLLGFKFLLNIEGLFEIRNTRGFMSMAHGGNCQSNSGSGYYTSRTRSLLTVEMALTVVAVDLC